MKGILYFYSTFHYTLLVQGALLIRQLHLHQPLEYCHPIQIESSDQSVGTAYESVLTHLDQAPIGTDCLITGRVKTSDELSRAELEQVSERLPEDSTEAITSIPAGTYRFQQLPFTPESKVDMLPLFMKFISTSHAPTVYIRIYKEKRFETAVQFFIPVLESE